MTYSSLATAIFFAGLGGAMTPGAMLTFTVYRSVKQGKHGYREGISIALGHGTIEILMMIFLVIAVNSIILSNDILAIIGIIGGTMLIFIGITMFIPLLKNTIDISFLDKVNLPSDEKIELVNYEKYNTLNKPEEGLEKQKIGKQNNGKKFKGSSYTGGMFFTITNPFWIIWWLTVGVAIILENGVSFTDPISFIVLIIAKEIGQFLWYTFVGSLTGFSTKFFTPLVYKIVLGICAGFMIFFGAYLAYSAITEFILS